MSNVLWQEGDSLPPVSPRHPLLPLESRVLQVWLDNSPRFRAAYSDPLNRLALENAVRERVQAAWLEQMHHRAAGRSPEEAEDLTAPAMWTPPTWPIVTRSPTPTAAAKPPDTSSSTAPTPSPESDREG